MKIWRKIVNHFCKSSILDVRLSFEDASTESKPLLNFSKNKAADLFTN